MKNNTMQRGLFALLCVSVWINYIDRGILGVAAPALAPEMNLNPARMGILLSGFFWTYSLLQPLAGWLVDRYDVYRVYAAGFAVWSLAAASAGLAGSFEVLLLTRLALGAGESLAYPAYSKLLANSFDESRRGLANAMVDVGTKAGPALGTFAGGMAIHAWGWRPFFLAMGGLSLLWLIPWLRAAPRPALETRHAAHPSRRGVPLSDLLARRNVWVTCCGLFCFNYAFYFLLTWLPSYLVKERRFSLRAMAIYGALPFCATAVASLAGGAWSDRRIRQGAPAGPLRRRVAVTGLVLSASMLMASALAASASAMVCLIVAFVGIGLFTCNAWAITQTLAGPRLAGSWTGWQNAVGNLGGVVAPVVTGWSVEWSGSFLAAFAAASGMLCLSAVFYGVLFDDAAAATE